MLLDASQSMGESSTLVQSNLVTISPPCYIDTSTQIMNQLNNCSQLITNSEETVSTVKENNKTIVDEVDKQIKDEEKSEKVTSYSASSSSSSSSSVREDHVKGYHASNTASLASVATVVVPSTAGDQVSPASAVETSSIDTGSRDNCEISTHCSSDVSRTRITVTNESNGATEDANDARSKENMQPQQQQQQQQRDESTQSPRHLNISRSVHTVSSTDNELNPPDVKRVTVSVDRTTTTTVVATAIVPPSTGRATGTTSNDTIWPLTTTSSTHSHMDLGSEDDEDAYEGGPDEDEDDDIEEDDLSDDYYLSDGSHCSSSNMKSDRDKLCGTGGRNNSKHSSDLLFTTPSNLNNNVIINGKQYDMSCKRYAVLTYDQVVRLDQVMDTVIPIHGRGNFPTLEVKLKDLVQVVRYKLQADSVDLRDIRLNGGAASYVLSSSNYNSYSYTDLDLIFGVNLNESRNFDKVRTAVFDSLLHFLPSGVNRNKMNSCTLKEAYVHKMVKVTEGSDRWSLISLCNNNGRDIEIKFVDTMKRQFEFSVDSFQIILDSLLLYYECSSSSSSSSSVTLTDCVPVKSSSATDQVTVNSPDIKSPVDSCIDSDDSSTCSSNASATCLSNYHKTDKTTSDEDDDDDDDEDDVHSSVDCCADTDGVQKKEKSLIAKLTLPQCDRSSNCKVNSDENVSSQACSSSSTSSCYSSSSSTISSGVSSATKMSENIYPTVVGESIYGDFSEALNHLTKKLIATRNPEEIRGGGLLKYCRLQVLGYTPARWDEIKILEKYMCSRFFIDFPDVSVQRLKLANYLNSHFHDDQTKYDYLMILNKVVDESTVCLMGHERRQTLALIEEFAYHYYYQEQQLRSHQQQQQQQQQHLHHHHHHHAHHMHHHPQQAHHHVHHHPHQHHLHASHAHYNASIHSLTNSNQSSMPMHTLHPTSTQYHHMIRSNSYATQHSQAHQQQQQSTYELSPCQVTFYHSTQSNCHHATVNSVNNCSTVTHSTQQQQQSPQQQQQQQQQQQSMSQEMQGNVPEHNSTSTSTVAPASTPVNHVHATLLMTSNGHYYYSPYAPSTYSNGVSGASSHVHHHQAQLPPGHHHHHHHHHAQNGHVVASGHHSTATSCSSSSSSSSSSTTNSTVSSTSPSTINSGGNTAGYPCYNCPCCLGQWMPHCM